MGGKLSVRLEQPVPGHKACTAGGKRGEKCTAVKPAGTFTLTAGGAPDHPQSKARFARLEILRRCGSAIPPTINSSALEVTARSQLRARLRLMAR